MGTLVMTLSAHAPGEEEARIEETKPSHLTPCSTGNYYFMGYLTVATTLTSPSARNNSSIEWSCGSAMGLEAPTTNYSYTSYTMVAIVT